MAKFESNVKIIPYSQEKVYNKLSDLNNLEGIKDKIPEEKIKDLVFDADTVSFSISSAGNLSLRVAEREPVKCIKFETVVSPMPLNLCVQIVPLEEDKCKLKLTVNISINPLMKGVIGGPLQDGVEKIADLLTTISY